jgi:PAS domain S-box-containing protein
MLAKHFGLRLKYLRKVRNLTQAQLAQAADISVPYLGRVERGLSSPSFEIIKKISEALETEPANLFLPPGRGNTDTESPVAEGAASPLTAPFSCTCWTRFGVLLWELPDGDEHWSREFWHMLGYGDRARKTASTELLLQHVSREHRPRVAATLQHARRGNPVNDLEFLLVRKDGERRDVVLHLDVVRDSLGNPRSLHGTALDITEWRQLHAMLMVNQKELEAYVRERTEELSLTVAELKQEMAARERAEEALRESEERYRLLAEHSSDVIWTMNARHEVDYISPSVRRLFGYTPEEYARIPLERHLSDESWQRLGPAMAKRQQSMRAGAPDTGSYRFELQHYTASGQTIWVDIVSTPIVDEQGTIQGFVGITRDIDARKRAEIALRDLAKLMRGMADNLPDLVWAKDLEGRFLFVNQAMCDMLLKAEDTREPLGKTDLYFAQRERAAGHEHTFGEVCVNSDEVTLRTLEPGRFLEDGLVRGQYLALDVHKAPFHDAGGALIGTVGAGRDVTADLAAREALKRSVAMLEEAQRIAKIGSWENDLRNGDVIWSDQIFRLLGYAPGEVAPSHERFREHLHPEDRERVAAAIEASRASGVPCGIECRILRKDGETRGMLLQGEVLLDGAGRPVRSQGTMRDITERRRMEEALRESEERLNLALDTVNEGVWDWRVDTGEVYFNSVSRLSGLNITTQPLSIFDNSAC